VDPQCTKISSRDIAAALRHSISHRWAASWPSRITWVILLFLWAAIWTAAAAIFPDISREHGPMEAFQASTLAAGCLLLASISISKNYPRPTRIVAAGLSLFFLTFFLLEFDTRYFNSPLLRRLTNGGVRNAWLGSLVLIYAIQVIRSFNTFLPALTDWLSHRTGMIFVASGFFWVAGFIVDKFNRFDDKTIALLLEELMETEAALLMGICAIITKWSWAKRRRLNPS
jgi:hypothetical protein